MYQNERMIRVHAATLGFEHAFSAPVSELRDELFEYEITAEFQRLYDAAFAVSDGDYTSLLVRMKTLMDKIKRGRPLSTG